MQAERERLAELELRRQQEMQSGMQNQGRLAELEREILSMRGQWERDQMMLERYDGVSLRFTLSDLSTSGSCSPFLLVHRSNVASQSTGR